MRILSLTKRLELIGGAERSHFSVLRELSLRGHEICLLHEPDGAPSWSEFASLVEIKQLQVSGRMPWATVGGLFRSSQAARRFTPDVVYSYLHYQLPIAFALSRAARVPFVHHARVAAPAVAARRRYWAPLRRATSVICVSHFTTNQYLDAGLDPDKCITIYNGLDVEHYRPLPTLDRLAFRRRIGLRDGDVGLVFSGRSSSEKGLALLAEVLRGLHHDQRFHCLVLTESERPEEAERDALRQLRGLGALVIAWQDDVRPYLAASDIAIVPSQVPETFGRSVVEPMFCGTPVLASAIGAFPEILSGELNRFLFDPFDPGQLLRRVRWLSDWWRSGGCLGEHVRTSAASRFSLNVTVDRVEDVLCTAISQAPRQEVALTEREQSRRSST